MTVKHVYNSIVPKLLKVDAIVLYPFIFFKDKYPSGRIIRHELVHVDQIKKYGWFRFYLSYIMEYASYRVRGLSHYDSYMKISYEVEAYKLQEIV
jgi:hypothetical protein